MANERSPSLFALTDDIALRSGDLIVLLARLAMGWLFLSTAWTGLTNVSGAAGYLAGWRKLLGGGATEALNSLVYWFALPAALFLSMARQPIAHRALADAEQEWRAWLEVSKLAAEVEAIN